MATGLSWVATRWRVGTISESSGHASEVPSSVASKPARALQISLVAPACVFAASCAAAGCAAPAAAAPCGSGAGGTAGRD